MTGITPELHLALLVGYFIIALQTCGENVPLSGL